MITLKYMNDADKLREEFEKEFPLENAGCDGCHSSQKFQIEVMNWWLSKLLQERKDLVGEIEKWAEDNWSNFYDSSKPLADFKKELIRFLSTINNKDSK